MFSSFPQSLFYFKLYKNNQPQTLPLEFKHWWRQQLYMKRLDIFFQLFYFGFFKKIIRLLTKCVKPICKLFFPKCLVVQGKGFTWEKGEGKFHVWTYFIINFTLCLIFLKVCSKDDPPFQIRQITRIIYYICSSLNIH